MVSKTYASLKSRQQNQCWIGDFGSSCQSAVSSSNWEEKPQIVCDYIWHTREACRTPWHPWYLALYLEYKLLILSFLSYTRWLVLPYLGPLVATDVWKPWRAMRPLIYAISSMSLESKMSEIRWPLCWNSDQNTVSECHVVIWRYDVIWFESQDVGCFISMLC